MPTENKTKVTEVMIDDFLDSFVDNDLKKRDSYRLIELLREWSGYEPKMWGPSIIGFGQYHYQYASGHSGEAPILGFSPRKAAFSLYVNALGDDNEALLQKLGKYKMAKACIYVKKLDDLDLQVLEDLCRSTMAFICKQYDCGCK